MSQTLPQSYIQVNAAGQATSYVGPAATTFFAAMTVKHGIRMWVEVGMLPNRAWTPSRMLAKAAEIMGREKPFPKSKAGGRKAVAELDSWIAKTRATLPVVQR